MEGFRIVGRFWVKKDGKNFLGDGRVELLRKIHASGSISKAAKEMKMSYKAAWDDVDTMNNLAEKPLISSAAGGKRGGGTKLTDAGTDIIAFYENLHEYFDQFINSTQYKFGEVHTSIINQENVFKAGVREITQAGNNVFIDVSIGMDLNITALVSLSIYTSIKNRGVDNVKVIIPPSSLMLVRTSEVENVGATNIFNGAIRKISDKNGRTSIEMEAGQGINLIVEVSKRIADRFKIAVGDVYCAVCKDADIIVL